MIQEKTSSKKNTPDTLPPIAPIPVSKGHWLLKNAPSMSKDALMHFYNKEQELGTTYESSLPGRHIIVTSDPDFMRYVLLSNQRNYIKGQSYEVLKKALGNGLISSNGDFWKRQRRLAQPAFHKKNLEELFQVMGGVAEDYFAELAKKRGTEVDISREMMAVTANIVLKALFSDTTEEDLNKVYDGVTNAQRHITEIQRNPLKGIWYRINGREKQARKDADIVQQVVLDAIAKRRKSDVKYPDLLQMMMDATDEESNEQMNDQQLRDEMMTMFGAGHETSANALTWILYLLTSHPEVLTKMRTEIDEVVGDHLPSFQELRQLTYIRQVIDEGLRLYPPAWAVSRTAIEPDEYRGIKIKKNDVVFCTIYNAHHRDDLFPNAKKFDPERFAPEQVKSMQKMSYLPFGGGPRLCIGNMFAIMEMQLLLVGLLQRFDFELVPNQQIEMEALITLRPKYGMKMVVR